MDKKPTGKLSVVVTLFLAFLCVAATFGLQIETKRILCEYAVASVGMEQNEATAATAQPTADEAATAVSEPVFTQITETVTEKVTVAKQVQTTAPISPPTTAEKNTELSPVLVVNTNTKKIHSPNCTYVQRMKSENRAEIEREDLPAYLQDGYTLCGVCKGYAQ